MMYSRIELKERAKRTMDGQYWRMVVVALVYMILSCVLAALGQQLIFKLIVYLFWYDSLSLFTILIPLLLLLAFCFFIVNPLLVGIKAYHIQATKGQATYATLGYAFKNNYWNIVKIMAIVVIKTMLWSLLLIIPGIIKKYEYAMIPYLLAEDSNLSMNEAFSTTKQMMTGNKFNLFVLGLSFILWYILCYYTCGIGYLFLNPYQLATYTQFYLALKQQENNQDWV